MAFMIALIITGIAFVILVIMAVISKRDSVFKNDVKQRNPVENKKVIFVEDKDETVNADGARGHLEITGNVQYNPGIYDRFIKRFLDIIVSLTGLIILSPFFLALFIAVKSDDPGPAIFTQKRIGRNKQYFKLHKFRSMKMSAPHDVPTHMLDDPEQYYTGVGRFMRRYSLDELPQIWDIFIGNISIIGPRPALWNQDLLIAERERWGANEVKPGLSGLAQINGRDELNIPMKAEFDGKYAEQLKRGGWKAFALDCRCFAGTLVFLIVRHGSSKGRTDGQGRRDGWE